MRGLKKTLDLLGFLGFRGSLAVCGFLGIFGSLQLRGLLFLIGSYPGSPSDARLNVPVRVSFIFFGGK